MRVNKANLNWAKADAVSYQEFTRIDLDMVHSVLAYNSIDDLCHIRPDLFTQTGINNVYNNIIHVLINAAFKTVPLKNNGHNTGEMIIYVVLKKIQLNVTRNGSLLVGQNLVIYLITEIWPVKIIKI